MVLDNRLTYKKVIEYSLYLSCLLSNLSQFPYFVNSGITQYLNFPGWILLFFLLIFTKKDVKITKNILTEIILAIFILIGILTSSLITSYDYISSSLLYSFSLSFFIFFIGSQLAPYINDRIIQNIIKIYCLTTIVVSVSIFIKYFGFTYNWTSRIYGYGSKNSISLIIFTTIILLIMSHSTHNTLQSLFRIIGIGFEIVLLLCLRSRATFIGLFLSIIIILVSKNIKKSIKIIISFILILVIYLLLTNKEFNNLIFNNIIFAGRNPDNLDDLSSGRVSILSSFPILLQNKWLTGIGSIYFECFPLSAILQFGLITGILMIVFALLPLIYGYYNRHKSNYNLILFILSVGYITNSLFEGIAPFGPGIKCYFLWLLFGILVSSGNKNHKYS